MKTQLEFPNDLFEDAAEMSEFVKCALRTESILRYGQDVISADLVIHSGHQIGATIREANKAAVRAERNKRLRKLAAK